MGWLLTDRRIAERANLGHLRSGQDDQHREDQQGRGRKDGLNGKVPDRLEVRGVEDGQDVRSGLGLCGAMRGRFKVP